MKYTAANSIFCLLVLFIFSFGQENDQNEYRLLLNEALLFQKLNPADRQSALLDSARYYAANGEFDLAAVFLEQYVDRFKTAPPPQTVNRKQETSLHFALQTGVDFNRQEFEVGYIQSDSVLREELNKPYVAAEINKEWSVTDRVFLQAGSRLRYDKENFTLSAQGGATINGRHFNLNVQAGYDRDRNKLYPDFSYHEGNTRQSIGWYPLSNVDIQADNIFRYKQYQNPSSAVPSFYHDQLDLTANYRPSFDKLWQMDYMLDFNESIHYENNDYSEQGLSLFHSRMLWGLWQVQLKSAYNVNRFTYAISDSAISNRAGTIHADVTSRVFLGADFSWNAEYQGKWKRYTNKSEQEADYRYQHVQTSLRKQLAAGFFVETGYSYETKKHFLFPSAVKEYIEEQNYFGHGISFSVEYSNINSYLLMFNTVYTWRRYPDAHSDNSINLYANRNILNFNLLAQIPVWKGIFFNIFASYDNDQDLDTENSNARNSFFSAEIEYRF